MGIATRLMVIAMATLGLVSGWMHSPSNNHVDPIATTAELVVIVDNRIALVDPVKHEVRKYLSLPGPALDYAIAPHGKVYFPLPSGSGDQKVAVYDPRSGTVANISSSYSGDLITITDDGTAFIRSEQETQKGALIVVLDTNVDKVIGTVSVPGYAHRPAALTGSTAAIPVSFPEGGGNVYLVDRSLGTAKAIFPFNLEPFGPTQIIGQPNSPLAYFLYSGLPQGSENRETLKAKFADEALLDTHIDVWNLESHQLIRRIPLPTPSAQNMVLAPDGQLYVGHMDMMGHNPIERISVVNPNNGEVVHKAAAANPFAVIRQGDFLYVASRAKPLIQFFSVAGAETKGEIQLEGAPLVPPLSR